MIVVTKIGTSDLPEMYAQNLRTEGICTYQANHEFKNDF